MASFFRRKRGLIFKFVIGIPILWFAAVLLMTYQGSQSHDSRVDTEKRNFDSHIVQPPQHVPVAGDVGIQAHDRQIHQEEQRRFAQKMEEERLEKEREEREKRNIELIEKQKREEIKNNPVLKFEAAGQKEELPERPYVDPDAPGMLLL